MENLEAEPNTDLEIGGYVAANFRKRYVGRNPVEVTLNGEQILRLTHFRVALLCKDFAGEDKLIRG